jgi:ubiquinone biosynthesis accessory factor UbiJ
MAAPRPSPFDALKPIAGRALESALNRALTLDPDTRDGVRRLDGQRIELLLESPPLALQLRVDGERLRVGPVDPGSEPDLAVHTTLAGMLSQLPFLRRDDAPPVGKVRVSGDADLARQLQRLAERFDPDWHQPFTAVFGDVVGVQVAQAFAAALRGARTLGGKLARDAAGYVVEESRDVVGREELNAFHDDVDALRDGVERIAARIARMPAPRGRAA